MSFRRGSKGLVVISVEGSHSAVVKCGEGDG